MKIEKVNDHQIRCTLTREDLANRELKISELAYGTDKAKDLFRDMMQQAAYEFGFEAEDIPLMIEAVPLNSECIVLIVTKVEDPEELDTRLARFSPSVNDDDSTDEYHNSYTDPSDEVMDLFEQIHKLIPTEKTTGSSSEASGAEQSDSGSKTAASYSGSYRVFRFKNLAQVTERSHVMGSALSCDNTRYKKEGTGQYLLVINQADLSQEAFGRICNTISEYGESMKQSSAGKAYMEEHYAVIIRAHAIQTLAEI